MLARFIGSLPPERSADGLPGHCDACVLAGHTAAHPDLGCADVGCSIVHGTDAAGQRLCADCGHPITGYWLSDCPAPGEPEDQLRFWHTGPSACRQAALAAVRTDTEESGR